MAENLILYYSRKGENYWSGGLKELKIGNTEIVAEYIQKAVGGDLFEIETVQDYSPSYMTCIEEAKDELRRKARPELKNYLPGSNDSWSDNWQYVSLMDDYYKAKGNGTGKYTAMWD